MTLSSGPAASPREGATTAPPPRPARTAASTATAVSLFLKNLFLRDRDGLAPPAFLPRQRDVLAAHLGSAAFRVAHGEEHVLAGREVGRMRLPGGPLLARGAAHRGDEQPTRQQEQRTLDSHDLTSE